MAYQQMALIYDKFMEDAPYDQWVHFTEEIIKQSGRSIKSIADLGCGTGEIAISLAKHGYDVIGVDYSSEMLTIAEQKASNQQQQIQWIHQDLKELAGLVNLDAVISYCDVINYITCQEDLRVVFKNIADSLKVGGLFIFDVHSLFHVSENLVNQTFADVTDECSYIWFCSEGEEEGEMYHDLTFFMLDGEKYARFDESHYQRTFSIDFYKKLLADAGLEILNLYGDFSLKKESLQERTERIFFITEKRSG